MIFEFIFSFGLVTPLLLVFRPETIYRESATHQDRGIPRLLRWIHGLVLRKPGLILSLCVAVALWGAWRSRDVKVETNLVEWFQSSSPVRRDAEFIQKNMSGIMSLDLFLESNTAEAFRDPATVAFLERLQTQVKNVAGVDTAISLVDYLKEMNKSFHNEDSAFYKIPSTRVMLDQYLLLYSADDLDDYVTPDFRRTRICLRIRTTSTSFHARVLKEIESIIQKEHWPGVTVKLSGDVLIQVRTLHTLVGEQLQNVLSAVGTIWLVMAVVLGSLGMAALFLVPNLFPILINFGIMGALGISLDTGTSLIAAAAFGVIVDDTVHFFIRFQELRRQGKPYFPALEEVSNEKGEASTSSFLILCAGFGVLALSQFRPIMFFGVLNVVVMVVGFAGDQLLLKSLMVLWGKRKSHSPTPS